MNTGKQVNVMVGLLMVFAVGTLLYFLWDDDRASEAESRQLATNAERGGALYSLNCRACHGLTGLGPLENAMLPGLPLNTDQNRNADQARQNYLKETIRCGRLGTLMPPWHTDFGGSLNDFQIFQLVTLITSAASEEGWAHAIERANHADEFAPTKHLTEAVGADDTTLTLDYPRGLRPGQLLRVDEEPTDEVYEIVSVVDAPAGSLLTEEASADATELTLQEAAVFEPGDVIAVGDEIMSVVSAPASTKLSENVTATATTLTVVDAEGLAAGDLIKVDGETMEVSSVSGNDVRVRRGAEESEATEHVAGAAVTELGNVIEVRRGQEGTLVQDHRVKSEVYEVGNTIVVERAAFGTKAAEHPAGAEVFNGPILPGTTITGSGEGFPPCGQSKALVPTPTPQAGAATPAPGGATPAPTETQEISGTVDVIMGDNYFEFNGVRNPTFRMAAGAAVTINLKNEGAAIHNMRTAGADGQYQNADDHVSDPQIVSAGGTATIQISFDKPGTYLYRCDFHATQMLGEIVVE